MSENNENVTLCIRCKSSIHPEATVCPHCKVWQDPQEFAKAHKDATNFVQEQMKEQIKQTPEYMKLVFKEMFSAVKGIFKKR